MTGFSWGRVVPVAVFAWSLTIGVSVVADDALGPSPAAGAATDEQVALEIDRLLADEVLKNLPAGQSLAAQAGDEIFLRRVYLDLVGRAPKVGEITAFALDSRPNKRQATIDQLLADPQYGVNWSRYWRDVILARQAMLQQGQLVMGPLESFLNEQLNQNTGWDKIAGAFVEAKGVVADHGEGAIFVAQLSEPVDVAAEMSRVFLGVQIQCAQCHDHPSDRWKRRQFHEFAAFFPRVSMRRAAIEGKPSLELAGVDNGPVMRRPGQQGQAGKEHFMPDLKDPSSPGTEVAPVFFATDKPMATGTTDDERRHALAVWMTAKDNPWFAKAFVNRIWAELVGEGFYEPVDDIGPERHCSAPKTLDYLAAQFADRGYDVKWLFRTITATDAYRRQSRPKRLPDETPFTANVPRRLRADQLIDVLSQAVGINLFNPPPDGDGRAFGGRSGARQPFYQLFGFDPSLRREEISDSIPQALFLMNTQFITQAATGQYGRSTLSDLLSRGLDDEETAAELYLQILSRQPSKQETAVCLDYIKQVGDRTEAFEDLYWSLLNSEEIRYRN